MPSALSSTKSDVKSQRKVAAAGWCTDPPYASLRMAPRQLRGTHGHQPAALQTQNTISRELSPPYSMQTSLIWVKIVEPPCGTHIPHLDQRRNKQPFMRPRQAGHIQAGKESRKGRVVRSQTALIQPFRPSTFVHGSACINNPHLQPPTLRLAGTLVQARANAQPKSHRSHRERMAPLFQTAAQQPAGNSPGLHAPSHCKSTSQQARHRVNMSNCPRMQQQQQQTAQPSLHQRTTGNAPYAQ